MHKWMGRLLLLVVVVNVYSGLDQYMLETSGVTKWLVTAWSGLFAIGAVVASLWGSMRRNTLKQPKQQSHQPAPLQRARESQYP